MYLGAVKGAALKIFKKIVKILLWVLVGIFALVVLVCAAVYIPGVQKYAVNKASAIVEQTTGMRLSVDMFRLSFPIGISVYGANVVTAEGDTLARVGALRARVALFPLLAGKVTVRGVSIGDAASTYRDTVSGMVLRARLSDFTMGRATLGLKNGSVDISHASLSGADVVFTPAAPSTETPPQDTTSSAPLKIELQRLDIADVRFAMDVPASGSRLEAMLGKGDIRDVTVDLADVLTLGVGDVDISHTSAAYTSPADIPSTAPFDPSNIRAENIALGVRNVRYTSDGIYASLERLALVERSGLAVKGGSGDFSMTSEGISLSGFDLKTASSLIKVDARAGEGVMRAESSAPVSLNIAASVGLNEVLLFAPLSSAVSDPMRGENVEITAVLEGTLGDISLKKLTVSKPGQIDFSAHGELHSVVTPAELSGDIAFDGRFRDLDFVKGFVADTALKRRIAFPHVVTLRGEGEFSPEMYNLASLMLTTDAGRLDASARFAVPSKTYAADVRIADFPLGEFLPQDSLGVATLTLAVHGCGFDPFGGMSAGIDAEIERFDYKGFAYHDIVLAASLSDGVLDGRLSSSNKALSLDLTIDGELERDDYSASLRGDVWRADLHRMGFSEDILAVETRLDVTARASRDTLTEATADHTRVASLAKMRYTLAAQIDSTVVRFGETAGRIGNTRIEASAAQGGISAAVRSGDLSLELSSPLPPDSLVRSLGRVGNEVRRQIAARHFSADSLQATFPGVTLTAKAGRGNFLRDMALVAGIDFHSLAADVSTTPEQPFHIDMLATGFSAGKLAVDTLGMKASRNGSNLDYALRMVNRPENVDNFALITLSGSVGGNAASLDVYELGRNDSVGLDFGVNASLQDKAIRAAMTTPDPVLGYRRWRASEGNYVEYGTDGKLCADLHLAGPTTNEYIIISSDSLPDIPDGALRLRMSELDVTPILDLLPTGPPLGGTVSSDITFGLRDDDAGGGKIITATGDLGIGNFTYNSKRVADVAASVDFLSNATGGMALAASVLLDRATALTAEGTYTSDAIDFDIAIPALPLAMAQAFIPDGTAKLSGALDGNVRISGAPTSPAITGDVGFTGARAEVEMIGTTFGISTDRITLDGGHLSFNGFGITSPGNHKLAIDGTMDISDFSNPIADIGISTTGFRIVDSQHIGGSQIYGTAAFDADITAKGALSSMTVKGDIRLSDKTDVHYILRNRSKVTDERQHLVTFAVFADSLYTGAIETAPSRTLRTGVDLLVGVEIPDGVKATLSLDEQNENRVEVAGGGDLAFSMNTQGDMRLAGRYTLSGGSVYYSPPVISQKIFDVTDGSYVEWTGEATAPEFHVAATMNTTVDLTHEDGSSQQADFEITIDISGSLEAMDIRFDLAAPGNLMIQNELMAMSDEARMQQALTLLVYDQYTGLGYASQKKGAFDARGTLNDFISKEVNQWARNNLKGVDLSMGIETRDDALGNSHTDYSYSVSKSLFSDRVKVSIGGSVADDATSQNFAGNLVEDVTLEYRLTDRDNMFLKLYRYNTRESILEGEVTETGGGFVLRKKIERLGDLFRRSGSRKTNNEK